MSEAASPTGLSTTGMVVPITQVGALSQAWYDALGYEFRKPQKAAPAKVARTVNAAEPRRAEMPVRRALSPFEMAQRNAESARLRRPGRTTVSRSRLIVARDVRKTKIKASVHPPQPDVFRHSAGRITIISSRGIVRMLMQRVGGSMRITAVCDPKIVATIADALATTRTRLMARGVTVQTSTHPEAVS